MTRINVVPVYELSGRHLVAEYRELPRVFKLALDNSRREKKAFIPPEYTLGRGHVSFFYDKLFWVAMRFYFLVAEMKKRGYTPSYEDIPNWAEDIPDKWWDDYTPTEEDLAINRQRIKERS